MRNANSRLASQSVRKSRRNKKWKRASGRVVVDLPPLQPSPSPIQKSSDLRESRAVLLDAGGRWSGSLDPLPAAAPA